MSRQWRRHRRLRISGGGAVEQWRVSTAGRRATAEDHVRSYWQISTNINNNNYNDNMNNLALLGFAIAMLQTKNQLESFLIAVA